MLYFNLKKDNFKNQCADILFTTISLSLSLSLLYLCQQKNTVINRKQIKIDDFFFNISEVNRVTTFASYYIMV